jgi:hypothetical protein
MSKFLISFAGVPVSLYLMYNGIVNYKKSKSKSTLYYVISFGLLALAMILFTPTALLREGQTFFAELTLGGSFILMMILPVAYIEYFHGIYMKVPYFSKLFYFAVGGGFVTLLFQPWEIRYINTFYGFSQRLSDILIICMFIQLMCIFIIMVQTFRVIKAKLDTELVDETQKPEEDLDDQKSVPHSMDYKKLIQGKKRILNYIALSYLVGMCLIGLGLLIPGSYWDSVGIVVVVGPQAYFFSRDNEILVYLSTQKIREGTIKLKKDLNKLHQQSITLPKNVEVEIQSMVDFIEKADLLIRTRGK